MELVKLSESLFTIRNEDEFNQHALEVFRFQYNNNIIYRSFCNALKVQPETVTHYLKIPFLPLEFFKEGIVVSTSVIPSIVFTSSGTTGPNTSRHYIHNPSLYKKSFTTCFRLFFGEPHQYHILALLPGYLEKGNSSLIYMTKELIRQSKSAYSGFYLNELDELSKKIEALNDRKIILLGVTHALLSLAENFPIHKPDMIVMETGGMKGKRKEMVREELHLQLYKAFGVKKIYSEYGMTELLSQAYSFGDGRFQTPPWMKTVIRELHDPFELSGFGQTGGVNIIDLANIYSCSFLSTQDLGKAYADGSFEITGRFDNSDVRGCNLLVS